MKPLIAIILGVLVTAGLAWNKISTSDWSPGQGQTPRELIADYMAMTYDKGQGAKAAQTYHAKDFKEHAGAFVETSDGAALTNTVEQIISDGLHIAVRHKVGAGRNAPGGEFVDIYRIERGKITDHWRAKM